jgi:stage II sporulation protein GA (sporulation sigma-E factor processing peptidase)
MATVIYLDLPLAGALCGLVQDATLLWMVGQISASKPGFTRLVAGGVIGAGLQFCLLLNQASDGAVSSWIRSPFVFAMAPLAMIGVTFFPVKIWRFLKLVGCFYLLAFLLAGFNWGLDMLNQRFWGWRFSFWWRFLFHVTLIFCLGELGWGVIHRKIWEQICLVPIRISWDHNQLPLVALLDTGNRLRDPLTKAPVVIVEFTAIKPYLPAEILTVFQKMVQGEPDSGLELPEAWQGRLRLLPFCAIGQEHGILVGFRPDQVLVRQKGREIRHYQAVVALTAQKLSTEGAFHALISPDLIRE